MAFHGVNKGWRRCTCGEKRALVWMNEWSVGSEMLNLTWLDGCTVLLRSGSHSWFNCRVQSDCTPAGEAASEKPRAALAAHTAVEWLRLWGVGGVKELESERAARAMLSRTKVNTHIFICAASGGTNTRLYCRCHAFVHTCAYTHTHTHTHQQIKLINHLKWDDCWAFNHLEKIKCMSKLLQIYYWKFYMFLRQAQSSY